ncbi:unnamed protein product [Moneuplotes crassus]|uniref:Uncharacterized protein n=1 Tax=Euplotes crassus TaxID=5936 RepID=A0AAD1XAS1_EUPCR|nr:unnamed protein product [Moneuplotes crassus]
MSKLDCKLKPATFQQSKDHISVISFCHSGNFLAEVIRELRGNSCSVSSWRVCSNFLHFALCRWAQD